MASSALTRGKVGLEVGFANWYRRKGRLLGSGDFGCDEVVAAPNSTTLLQAYARQAIGVSALTWAIKKKLNQAIIGSVRTKKVMLELGFGRKACQGEIKHDNSQERMDMLSRES